jgi:hypothetical protein
MHLSRSNTYMSCALQRLYPNSDSSIIPYTCYEDCHPIDADDPEYSVPQRNILSHRQKRS